MREFNQVSSRYDRIEWLGGGVFYTRIDNIIIEHSVSFADSDNYLRTGAFLQAYQNEFDELTFENAQMILRNEALGNNPLSADVCGYTAEEQRQIGNAYFDVFYPSEIAPTGEGNYIERYREDVRTIAINAGYNEDGVISLPEWQQSIEEYNNLNNEVIS